MIVMMYEDGCYTEDVSLGQFCKDVLIAIDDGSDIDVITDNRVEIRRFEVDPNGCEYVMTYTYVLGVDN